MGAPASLRSTCIGDAPLSFQWYQDAREVPGQTNRILTLKAAQAADEGDYTLVVTNGEGAATSEPARLHIVPPVTQVVHGEITNTAGRRLPYLYCPPDNYDSSQQYSLYIGLAGSGDLEPAWLEDFVRTTPEANVFRSYRQQLAHPVLQVYPARRPRASTWEAPDLPLLLGMIDRLIQEFNIDTNRVHLIGFSDGGRTTWELVEQRPDFFASVMVTATTGIPANPVAVKHVPVWAFCAADDGLVFNSRFLVSHLLQAGANPIYTEYQYGGHDVLLTAMCTPSFVDWFLGQQRGVPSTTEPLLSITRSTPEAADTTCALTVDLSGSVAACGRNISQVDWTNLTAQIGGKASGTNLWSASAVSLAPDQTNLLVVTATTTSWAPGLGGHTTFSDTLSVVCSPIRLGMSRMGQEASLTWSNGVPPFRVQRASELGQGDWVDLMTNATPPMVLPLEGQSGFYRVLGEDH